MNKLTSAEIISFFEQVRAPIESSSPTEAFQAVISVSPDLHRHLGKTAEMLMLQLFPKSLVVTQILRRDLIERLGVPEQVVYEGFDIGWWHAAKIIVPHALRSM